MRLFLCVLALLSCIAGNATAQNELDICNRRIVPEDGDLIFRSGVGKESEFVRDFSSFDKTFTHAGIVLKEGNTFWVYHMLGGISNFKGNLRKDSVQTFIRYPDNECFGIYHTSLTRVEVVRFKKYIDSIGKRKVVFDMNFKLNNKDSLYCTEMIVEGLKYASNGRIMMLPEKVDLSKTRYRLAFGYTQGIIWFYPVDKLQHSPFLKKRVIIFYPNYRVKCKTRS